jgi:hypothetical protein
MNDEKPKYPYVPLPRTPRNFTKGEYQKFEAAMREWEDGLRAWFQMEKQNDRD